MARHGKIVNIENKRIYDDTLGWSGVIDACMSQVKNDQLFFNLAFRTRVQYKTKRHYYLILLDEQFSGSSSATYSNSGMAHFRYAYRLQRKNAERKSPWKWESYAQVQYNSVLDLQFRGLIGTGLRWKFADKDLGKMFLGSSVFLTGTGFLSSPQANKNTIAIINSILLLKFPTCPICAVFNSNIQLF